MSCQIWHSLLEHLNLQAKVPVVPCLLDEMTAVRCGIDEYIVRSDLKSALDDSLEILVLDLKLFK